MRHRFEKAMVIALGLYLMIWGSGAFFSYPAAVDPTVGVSGWMVLAGVAAAAGVALLTTGLCL